MAAAALPPSGPYTVVYTDVDSSTAMNERLGDVSARTLLRRHHAIVREQLARHAGIELQLLGDGFKLAFAEPAGALGFAVDLQAALRAEHADFDPPPFSVRIGVHTGEAIQEGGDLFGRTVIVAQRILSRAHAGQVLVSSATAERAGAPPGARFLDRGLFHLKGLEAGLHLHELVYGAPPSSQDSAGAEPEAAARSPLVDRRRELALLEERLAEAEKGRGAVVLVSGEAGIGKTRLCTEFLESISRRGVRLAVGRGVVDGAPYAAVLDWLRQLLAAGQRIPAHAARELRPLLSLSGELAPRPRARRAAAPEPDAAVADAARARLYAALASLFAEWTRAAPFALLLDDAQWADPGSLQALRAIGRALTPTFGTTPSRLLILATLRGDDAESPALSTLLRELDHDRVLVRLPLAGLPDPDVRALLRTLLPPSASDGLAHRLVERSHGNPYFAEELSRDVRERGTAHATGAATHEPIPLQLKALLDERLNRLPEACLSALRLAALLGTRFRFQALLAASGAEPDALIDALEIAVHAHVLKSAAGENSPEFEFLHPLLVEVLTEHASAPRRQRMHLRIADALERVQPEAAAEIARHLLSAGESAPPERIARRCREAGEAALRLQLFEPAARLLEAALAAELRGAGEGPAADELRALLFPAVGQLGDLARARELGLRAIDALERAERVADADRARGLLARLLVQHALAREALEVVAPAATRTGPVDAARAAALEQYGVALDLVGEAKRMHAIALRLRSVARRLGSAELADRSTLLFRNWYANHTPDVGRALRLTRPLVARAESRRDSWDAAVYGADLGLFELVSGRVADALATLDRALAAAERIGAVATQISVRALRATCRCYRGEWDEVQQEWSRAAPLLGRVPGALRLGLLLWARSRTDAWLGRAGPPLPDADTLYSGIEQFKTDVLAGVAQLAAERGAPYAADLLARADRRQSRDGTGLNWLTATQAIAEGWIALGDGARAAAWSASLRRYRGTLLIGSTDLILGRIERLRRRFAAAELDLASAVRLARREQLRPLLALALHEQASNWRARGRRADLGRAERADAEASSLEAALGMRDAASSATRESPVTQRRS